MEAYDFLLLAFASIPEGEIRGRTKLQKTAYLLGVLTDTLADLGFRPHYYGPFSSEIAQAADSLCFLRFLTCEARGGDAAAPPGFEMTRYDYRLTDQGRQIAEKKKREYPEFWQRIERAAERLVGAGDPDYMLLSFAAKVWFMLGEKGGRATRKELSELAESYDWQLSPQQVAEAARYLSQLDLVRTTA